MKLEKCKDLMHWILREITTIDHGEIHIELKVRDGQLSLIEKTKIIKEKP